MGLEILEHKKHHLNKYISLLIRSFLVLFDLGPPHPQRNYACVRNLPERKLDFSSRKNPNPLRTNLKKDLNGDDELRKR